MRTFNDLLHSVGISPREVSLLRHQTVTAAGDTPFALRSRSLAAFERYQSTQAAGKPVFHRPRYWASFVAPNKLQTLFVGLYEVTPDAEGTIDWIDPLTLRPVGADKPGKKYELFRCTPSPILSEQIGRLRIDWNRSERSWAQHADGNDKALIVETLVPTVAATAGMDRLDPLDPETEHLTERDVLALARVGQGRFRADLFKLWGACALTGIVFPEFLRASHIKPWRKSTSAERLDPFNGLLLAIHVDALFDRNLIGFDPISGQIVVSSRLGPDDLRAFGIGDGARLRSVYDRNRPYLAQQLKLVRALRV